MIIDFIVGVTASITASIICGLFSKKIFDKSNDVLTSIYTIYISFSAFVFVILLTFILSENIQNAFLSWSGQSLFTVFKFVTSLFWIMFISDSFVTIFFIIFRQIEISQKNMKKTNKSILDYYSSQYGEGDKK